MQQIPPCIEVQNVYGIFKWKRIVTCLYVRPAASPSFVLEKIQTYDRYEYQELQKAHKNINIVCYIDTIVCIFNSHWLHCLELNQVLLSFSRF